MLTATRASGTKARSSRAVSSSVQVTASAKATVRNRVRGDMHVLGRLGYGELPWKRAPPNVAEL